MRRAPTRFSSSPTLRLTVDFGMARRLAAAVKLPASATAAKTTIAFRSGPLSLTVLSLEQSFQESYSSPTTRTMADLSVMSFKRRSIDAPQRPPDVPSAKAKGWTRGRLVGSRAGAGKTHPSRAPPLRAAEPSNSALWFETLFCVERIHTHQLS